MVIGTGQGQLDSPLQTGSSSLDLVRVLVGADVVLGLGVWPVGPLLERGAEVVALLVVLPSGLPMGLPCDGQVLLLERHGLQELDLLKADLLEEFSIPFVMLENREPLAVHLVDLEVGQIFEVEVQHVRLVGPDGLAGGHAVALGGGCCRFSVLRISVAEHD